MARFNTGEGTSNPEYEFKHSLGSILNISYRVQKNKFIVLTGGNFREIFQCREKLAFKLVIEPPAA